MESLIEQRSIGQAMQLPLDSELEDSETSSRSPNPPSYENAECSASPPSYFVPQTVFFRCRQLQLLGVSARNDLQRALVVGDTTEALRVCASNRTSHSILRRGTYWGDGIPGITDLHVAALFNDCAVLQSLLLGSNINAGCSIQEHFGERVSPLHFAIASCSTRTTEMLLEQGALLVPKKTKTKTGHKLEYYPPAVLVQEHWLALTDPLEPQDRIDMLKQLLASGWNMKSPVDSTARTMLHLAAELPQDRGNLRFELVSFLLANGADPLALSHGESSPLHLAARSNESPELVELLLRHNPAQQVLLRDHFGNTALHEAVLNRQIHGSKASIQILNALLANGALVNAKNKHGETPLCFARNRHRLGDSEAYSLLERYNLSA